MKLALHEFTSGKWLSHITLAALFLWLTASFAQAELPHAQLRSFAPGGIAIDWEHPNDGAASITLEREDPTFTWVFVATRLPEPAGAPPQPAAAKGVIYGITANDDLMWYRRDGRNDGTARKLTYEAFHRQHRGLSALCQRVLFLAHGDRRRVEESHRTLPAGIRKGPRLRSGSRRIG
jgi:hypothetical protein